MKGERSVSGYKCKKFSHHRGSPGLQTVCALGHHTRTSRISLKNYTYPDNESGMADELNPYCLVEIFWSESVESRNRPQLLSTIHFFTAVSADSKHWIVAQKK